MSRGRPTEQTEAKTKWTLKSVDYDGGTTTIKYDINKSKNGPYSIETTPGKGVRAKKVQIEKRSYNRQPVYMTFKTSNRSNAKVKIKKFNQNIDYILTQEKLPGVPKKAIIMDLGVGESFNKRFTEKYT